MEKKKFKYYRDDRNRPVVTLCKIMEDDQLLSEGIAICSTKDNPNKKIGRTIAEGRAMKALKEMCSNNMIFRDEALQVLSMIGQPFDRDFSDKSIFHSLP